MKKAGRSPLFVFPIVADQYFATTGGAGGGGSNG
jgi:hypothetical protein